MHYQPKVSCNDLRPVGAEALMRWYSRSRGEVLPEVFIPVAERTGQIKPMTIWALNTALRAASEWEQNLGCLSVAVNIPAELVTQHDLPDLVENALKLWGNKQIQLVLEITERSLVTSPEHSFKILSAVRELGVKVSIDDFGTGYSCLAYFRDIPVDELKIDKSFVSGLLNDVACADIANLIIDLAHKFGLSVVAEGVEDEATLRLLQQRKCDVAQGFLFAPALHRDEFEKWLNRRKQS
jgi:EAL domain-containing protein (putative c-di-GMP-specific phosphodiesterase class I)